MGERGLKALYSWGSEQKSITEILPDPRVYSSVCPGTYASLQGKVRLLPKL